MVWEEEEVRMRRRRMKRCQKEGWGEYNYSELQCDDRAGSSRLRRVSTNGGAKEEAPLTKLNVGEKAAPSTAHQAAADKSRQICSVLLLGIQHCSVLLSLGIQHHSGSNTKGHHRLLALARCSIRPWVPICNVFPLISTPSFLCGINLYSAAFLATFHLFP